MPSDGTIGGQLLCWLWLNIEWAKIFHGDYGLVTVEALACDGLPLVAEVAFRLRDSAGRLISLDVPEEGWLVQDAWRV